MHYMFLIYSQELPGGLPAESADDTINRHWAVMQDAKARGVLVGVDGLEPTSTATTIRMRDGRPITLDGPFAETKEQLAGYYIIDCKNMEEAIEWGKRIPTCCRGTEGCIEIRPIAELPRRPD